MMSKHYIYEIFGVKIGATNDVERRMKQQGAKEGEYRIIEEHTNAKICSIREIELQKEYNYPVDRIQYWKTLRNQKKSSTPQAQKKRVANTDFKMKVANTDYSFAKKNRFSQLAYTPEAQAKKVANTNYQEFQARKVANTNWEIRSKKFKKPINQYDIEGNLIKQWDSVTTICQTLWGNMSSQSNITNCCRGKFKIIKGYIWKYAG